MRHNIAQHEYRELLRRIRKAGTPDEQRRIAALARDQRKFIAPFAVEAMEKAHGVTFGVQDDGEIGYVQIGHAQVSG